MKVLLTTLLAFLAWMLLACASSHPTVKSGPLSANWQFNLLQSLPGPATPLAASGFLAESGTELTGSIQGPYTTETKGNKTYNCGGVGQLTGTLSGQNVNLSLDEGGTVFSLTGIVAPDNTSMSGDYEAQGGGCFTVPTTGTWNAFLVPALNGNFTGTITDSSYMQQLTGVSPPAPIAVSGTITQSANAGASNATLAGTMNAVGYPCFAKATMTGTISGQNVFLLMFGYNGEQIGFIGAPPKLGDSLAVPATLTFSSTGLSLVGTFNYNGLALGSSGNGTTVGPCPPINVNGVTIRNDIASVTLNFK